MWIVRLLLFSSVLASFAVTDNGVLIDPNGGGAMDPNGGSEVGSAIDPDGARLCYSGCVDPNG